MTHDELLTKINGNFPNEGTHLDQAIAIGNLYRQGLSALRAVVELHYPFFIWGDEDTKDIQYLVCAECCVESEEYQTEACANTHEHGEGAPYCPKTIPAIEKELS